MVPATLMLQVLAGECSRWATGDQNENSPTGLVCLKLAIFIENWATKGRECIPVLLSLGSWISSLKTNFRKQANHQELVEFLITFRREIWNELSPRSECISTLNKLEYFLNKLPLETSAI